MKLSEFSTRRAADVLCQIAPSVSNIMGDSSLMDTLKDKIDVKNSSVAEIFAHGSSKISAIIPIVLHDHRDDLFNILAVLNDTTPEDISSQNIMVTMNQIKCVVMDKELLDFFKSSRQEEATK